MQSTSTTGRSGHRGNRAAQAPLHKRPHAHQAIEHLHRADLRRLSRQLSLAAAHVCRMASLHPGIPDYHSLAATRHRVAAGTVGHRDLGDQHGRVRCLATAVAHGG